MSSRPLRRLATAAGVVVTLTVGGVACGTESQAPDATPSASDVSGAMTIDIKVTATSVDPQGEQVSVKVGQPVTLRITAEKAGELHVHSSPEQHVEYAAGTTEHQITLDKPGIVDVEDHGLDELVLKLEVR